MVSRPGRPAVRAVTFDFWDTIVAATVGSGDGIRRLQVDRFARTLAAAGRPVPSEELEEAFDANWVRLAQDLPGFRLNKMRPRGAGKRNHEND
jgi:hypothetical protein